MKKEQDNKLIGKVLNLNDLTTYQDGSVLSRQIINKKTGKVTIFAFDAGEGLSEHTSPFDAMIFVSDGEVRVTIAGEPHHLKAGEMIIMPANVPHALEAITRFKMTLVMIR